MSESGKSVSERYSVDIHPCYCHETRNFAHKCVAITDNTKDIDDGGQVSFCFDNVELCNEFINHFVKNTIHYWKLNEIHSARQVVRCACYENTFEGQRHVVCNRCEDCCKCFEAIQVTNGGHS